MSRTLRYIFGPVPGREWWCLDYENIELRIPAYEAGEREMIELFERPDAPPYFGSHHLLVAHKLHRQLFEACRDGKEFKARYKATWYQWVKNGNFAVQYGAQQATADRAYHLDGAYEIVREAFSRMAELNDKWVAFANKHGYVETLPDKTVDPVRGYPVQCTRSEWGKISPTVPLNYHVQSTAMWCTSKAMTRIAPTLADWRRGGFDAFIALQVHDELVLDFPAGGARNLPKVRTVKALMEESGDDIGVPLKVSVSYHPNNWGEAVDLAKTRGVA